MSHLEFWGTVAGAIAVWLAAKANIWSWALGLVNVVLFFFLFFQIQLYPDMFLQVFFFITNLMGWWQWTHPKNHEANKDNELKVSRMNRKNALIITVIGMVATVLMGSFSQNLNVLFPSLFSKPSAFPYLDSFTTVMSIAATFLMIKKKVENWYMWLAIDLIATYIYYVKGVKLVSIEYAVFCVIALFGAINWTKEYRTYRAELV